MFVCNVHYVIASYNEVKLQLLFETQLNKRRGTPLDEELIEQCLAGYLECKDSKSEEISKMESLMEELKINYSDHRCYSNNQPPDGNPENAVKIFNQLAKDFIRFKTEVTTR